MQRKFFTIEDLIKFCQEKKIYNFSAKESGDPIVVQSVQDFSNVEIEESDDGKLYAKVRVCHTLLNRNNSYISEDSMKEAMPTLKYAPLLAAIHQLDDGTWDFHSHDMHTEIDDDGNEYTVYDEKQIGTFTADEPYLEYDKEKDKTYVVAKVAIPMEYTRAAEIIKEKGGTKVSCELLIYDCSFNSKEHYLQLDHFRFNGCACLGSEKNGKPIGEGMEGSFLSLEDFSEDNNSLLKFIEEKLDEMQSTISKLDARFNIENTTKGGTELKKENFEEEVTDTEEVTENEESEEEVAVEEEESEEAVAENSEESEDEAEAETSVEEPVSEEENLENDNTVEYSFTSNGEVKKFAVSLQDKIYAIQDLVNATYAESDNTYYGVTVYDDYVIMQDWWNGRYYKQSYSEEDDTYSLTGDRVEVYVEFVTADEQKDLEEMRSNYSSIVEKLEKYEEAEIIADKATVFEDEAYSDFIDTDEFKNLMTKENLKKFSKEELKEKADAAYGRLMKAKKNFAEDTKVKVETKKKKTVTIFSDADTSEESVYGDYFKSVK